MMNNNHKNSGCGKASELVSYLYGETDAAENTAFETHLATCSMCADELEAYSGIQFSINDWKSTAFANLQTPVIEIPYPKAANKQEVSSVEESWLSRLSKLFTFARSWSLGAAAMAILAVCAGIFLYVSNSKESNFRAENNKNSKLQVSPTVEKSPEQKVNNSNRNLPDAESNPVNKQQAPVPKLAVEPNTTKNRAVKASKTIRQPQKTETTPLPKTNDAKRNDKKKNEIPPKIFDDEEEDDTLRLAEMFEEIDTIE